MKYLILIFKHRLLLSVLRKELDALKLLTAVGLLEIWYINNKYYNND